MFVGAGVELLVGGVWLYSILFVLSNSLGVWGFLSFLPCPALPRCK